MRVKLSAFDCDVIELSLKDLLKIFLGYTLRTGPTIVKRQDVKEVK